MRPRRIAHIAHRSSPTRTPNPRLATTPHACQSQSPAHVLTDVIASGDGIAEGSEIEKLDEDDIGFEVEDIDAGVDDGDDVVDRFVLLVLDTLVLFEEADVEAVLLGVAVTNSDLVVLTLVSVVQIATPSPFVVVVIVLSTVIPNSA